MSSRPAVVAEHVTKKYYLRGHLQGLREALSALPRRFLGKTIPDNRFCAVKDVSFQVQPGEAFGVIGPNGAGKTTMLRLLSGITIPTTGLISATGRIGAIIELGAGFHPELTGRENIHLYAAIMGMTPREVKLGFDEIVAFSELGPYLDMALKHYSSGMYVRLAFSVAAHLRPDVLLIDEVLAVGDAAFQTKSLRRIRELKETGTAIVFVSHNLHQVRVLCDRALLLYRGEVQACGETEAVVSAYLNDPHLQGAIQETYEDQASTNDSSTAEGARITRVTLLDNEGTCRSAFRTGEPLIVRIEYTAYHHIAQPTFTIAFYSVDGTMYAAHQTNWDGFKLDAIEGTGGIEAVFEHLDLLAGGYLLSISISDSQGFSKFDWHQKAYPLHVLVGDRASGLVYLRHAWRAIPPTPVSSRLQADP